jgi:signal transduction histidine kinase
MSLIPQSSRSLRNTLRYVEWTLIGVGLLLPFIDGSYAISPAITYRILVFNVIFLSLSFIVPLEGTIWQKRLYVAVNMAVVLFAQSFALYFDLILYWGIIKTCFLLGFRSVIITVILTGIGYLISVWKSIPYIEEMLASLDIEKIPDTKRIILNNLSYYLGASTFSISLSWMIIAERKSRKRAEDLAQEVEALAANLERSRIAREIHDSLGHTLTTLDVQLEVAQKLRQRNPEQALQALDTAKTLASQCLEDVRRALQTMRQSDFDLKEALYLLIAQAKRNHAFTIHLELDLPALPLQTSHQIYCIVQEGLMNIQKHAQATEVKLQAWATDNFLALELEDNGQGFELGCSRTGFGLRGIEERVQLLGGQLKINTTKGQGTHILVTIPRYRELKNDSSVISG